MTVVVMFLSCEKNDNQGGNEEPGNENSILKTIWNTENLEGYYKQLSFHSKDKCAYYEREPDNVSLVYTFDYKLKYPSILINRDTGYFNDDTLFYKEELYFKN